MTRSRELLGSSAKVHPVHLRLVQKAPDADTISTLEALIHLARRGEVTGIAIVCARPDMRYITEITGLCLDRPSFARGAAAFLCDQLAGLVHQRDENDIR